MWCFIAMMGFLLNMVDSLFFVPDEEQKGDSPDGYFYSKAEVGGIEGTCSYTMAAIIYDSDASLHPAFSCYKDGGGEGCQNGALGIAATTAQQLVNACIGVTSGLVESKLDPSVPQSQRKPKLSTKGKNCFIDDSYFGMLFNYTPGVNEKSCFDMPFKRAKDGKWEFDSDYYTSPGLTVPGGFYPVENTTDASILLADPNPFVKLMRRKICRKSIFFAMARVGTRAGIAKPSLRMVPERMRNFRLSLANAFLVGAARQMLLKTGHSL